MLPIKFRRGQRWLLGFLSLTVAVVAAVLVEGGKTNAQEITAYMSPYCGCCGAWVEHLRRHGYTVDKRLVEDVAPVRSKYGVPADLASCHTARVADYVVEGHVPAPDIRRLLDERPRARGLTVPGMPAGAPGMENAGDGPYEVLLIDDHGKADIFARY